MQIHVVDPTGVEQAERQELDLAPRPETLAGARLGLLDNGKPNAGHVLARAAAALAREAGVVEGPARSKALSSQPCPDALLAELGDVDVALVGVGD